MRQYLFIIVPAFFLWVNCPANAQSVKQTQNIENSISQDGKYALLVRSSQHLKAAIMTGEDFKARSEKIDFRIVMCGELVKELSDNDSLKNMVGEASGRGLKILACGLSVKQLSVDRSRLPESVSITENGLIYMFGLEENGFKTITL